MCLPLAGSRSCCAFAKTFLGGHFRCHPCRNQTENQCRDTGCQKQKHTNGRVDMNAIAIENRILEIMLQQAKRNRCDSQSNGCTTQCQQKAFGKKLLHQPLPARAEGSANGNFTSATVRARQHKPGNVCTCDEPDNDNCSVERKKRGARAFSERLAIVEDAD